MTRRTYRRIGLKSLLLRYVVKFSAILFLFAGASKVFPWVESASGLLTLILFLLFLIVTPVYIFRNLDSRWITANRIKKVKDYALRQGYAYQQTGLNLDNSSLYKNIQVPPGTTARYKLFNNHVSVGKYDFVDYSYEIYTKDKLGCRVTDKYFYFIASVVLPKSLPNVFFDSKKNKLSFRDFFSERQRYTFEGNFSDYFEAYLPDNYEIDILSFITPEVMEVLMQAADYDIEIRDGRLYLYAPQLIDPSKQFPGTLSQLAKIEAAVADNVRSYSDSSQAYIRANGTVGRHLNTSKRMLFIQGVIFSLAFLALFVLSIFNFGQGGGPSYAAMLMIFPILVLLVYGTLKARVD